MKAEIQNLKTRADNTENLTSTLSTNLTHATSQLSNQNFHSSNPNRNNPLGTVSIPQDAERQPTNAQDRLSDNGSFTSGYNLNQNKNQRNPLSEIEWFRDYRVESVVNGNKVAAIFRFGIGWNNSINDLDVIIPITEREILANEGVIARNPEQLKNLQDHLLQVNRQNYLDRRQKRVNFRLWNGC